MKATFLLLLASLAFTVNTFAGANAQSGRPVAKTAQTVTIIGIVTADEKNLITRQKQVWAVANAEILRDHAGQRVSIIAEIGPKEIVTVESIRVLTPKYPCCP
jgi:hypothetical protein